MNNVNSISAMKKYLRYAIEFEKYVYVWSHAMDEANQQMQQVYERRMKLDSIQSDTGYQLNTLDESFRERIDEKKAERKKYVKRTRLAVTIMCLSLVLFGLGVCAVIHSDTLVSISQEFAEFVIGGLLEIGLLGFVVCLILSRVFKKKARKAKNDLKKISDKSLLCDKETALKEKKSKVENDQIVSMIEETVVSERQEKISLQLRQARANLNQIYAMNILPAKYRCLNAVVAFYEYLDTGRCVTIQGHGGIYDTYETERVQLAQLEQMIQLNKTLSNIEANQRLICRELHQANQTLLGIQSDLHDIKATNEEIARNTAISSVANQQTAAAAQWMAWHKWANG